MSHVKDTKPQKTAVISSKKRDFKFISTLNAFWRHQSHTIQVFIVTTFFSLAGAVCFEGEPWSALASIRGWK